MGDLAGAYLRAPLVDSSVYNGTEPSGRVEPPLDLRGHPLAFQPIVPALYGISDGLDRGLRYRWSPEGWLPGRNAVEDWERVYVAALRRRQRIVLAFHAVRFQPQRWSLFPSDLVAEPAVFRRFLLFLAWCPRVLAGVLRVVWRCYQRTDHWVQVAAAIASVAPLSLLIAGRGGEEEEQGPAAQAPALPHNTSQ